MWRFWTFSSRCGLLWRSTSSHPHSITDFRDIVLGSGIRRPGRWTPFHSTGDLSGLCIPPFRLIPPGLEENQVGQGLGAVDIAGCWGGVCTIVTFFILMTALSGELSNNR